MYICDLILSSYGIKFFTSTFFFLRFYLFIHETNRVREAETHRQREEKKAPCKEPDAGLNPRSPGSHPGLKAALNR